MVAPAVAAAVAVLVTLVTAPTEVAYAQAGSSGRAIVSGTVFDSLVTNAPLVGAEVLIEGTELVAVADVRGQFRIEGVPAGRAVLRFYHARLDSLGFGAAPVTITVGDSDTVAVLLATPSPETFHSRLCPGVQPQSTGVLLGRVRDVDGHAPLPNADVTVRWGEWTVGLGALTRNERRTSSRTDANGAYVLCGVPTDVAVVARATGSGHVTGLAEVNFAQRLFDVRDFAVSLADSGTTTERLARLDSLIATGDSVGSVGSATIAGSVRGLDGKAVANAQVALFGFPVSARTNSDGVFQLANIPAGSQTIEIRAVGFAPQRRPFEIATGERLTVEISATRVAQTLAAVNIVGRGSRFDMTGFDDRRKAGIGRFIGPEEIERRHVFDTSQLLWNILGARVIWDGYENVVKFTRPYGTGAGGGSFNNLCNPAVFIDGYQVYDINEVRPYDVRAIEVYTDRNAAPSQYRAQSLKDTGLPDSHCPVVLVWTKPRPAKGKKSKSE